MLTPFHDPTNGPMRMVGLMSGSGTNLRRILEHERNLQQQPGGSPYRMVALFTDNSDSQANAIGRDFDLPVLTRDIRAFYAARNKPRRDMQLRAEFDRATVAALAPFQATVAVYGGYMSVATEPLIRAFLGVNVHPADLSVLDEQGRRRYTGDHAVRDAIFAGESSVRSSTHLIEAEVDGGGLLMISAAVTVEVPEGVDLSDPATALQVEEDNQERLKVDGDWVVFPQTLEAMARGRFARDETGCIHFDGQPIPYGWRL